MADRSLRFLLLGEDKSASKALKGVAAEAGRTHGHLAAIAGTFVGGAVAAGIMGFAKSSVDAFKETASGALHLRRVIGGSIEDASRLNFAAHESGVGQDDLSLSLRRLSKTLDMSTKVQEVRTRQHKMEIVNVPKLVKGQIQYVKALRDTGATTVKFVKTSKDLGFAYKDAHGFTLPMNKLLGNIADKFKSMPDGVDKTALALKLFGRAGQTMIPLLNKGAAGVAELMKQSDKLGVTITGKDAAGMKQYIQSQREWKAALEGVKISLGRELMPTFTQWARFLADHAPQINAWARKDLPELGKALGDAGRIVRDDLYPPVEKTFKFLSDHQGVAKVLGEAALGTLIFVKAMKGVMAVRGAIGVLKGIAAANTAVAGSEVAVAAGAPGAAAGIEAVGASAAISAPEFVAIAAAAYGFVKLLTWMDGHPDAQKNLLAGSPTATIDLPKRNPVLTFNGHKFLNDGSGISLDSPYKAKGLPAPVSDHGAHRGTTHVTHVHLDGKVIATVVNGHNAKATRNGSSSAGRAAGR